MEEILSAFCFSLLDWTSLSLIPSLTRFIFAKEFAAKDVKGYNNKGRQQKHLTEKSVTWVTKEMMNEGCDRERKAILWHRIRSLFHCHHHHHKNEIRYSRLFFQEIKQSISMSKSRRFMLKICGKTIKGLKRERVTTTGSSKNSKKCLVSLLGSLHFHATQDSQETKWHPHVVKVEPWDCFSFVTISCIEIHVWLEERECNWRKILCRFISYSISSLTKKSIPSKKWFSFSQRVPF